MSNILLPKPALGTPIAKGQLLSKGLVANFLFSDGRGDILSDFSFEKNHGLITGPTWAGDGLSFDGSDYVNLGDITILDGATQLTFIVQIRPDTLGANQKLLHKIGGSGDRSFQLTLATAFDEFTGDIWDGTNRFKLDSTNANMVNGQTYHMAFVWDGGNVGSLYLNGILVQSNIVASGNPQTITNSSEPLAIGIQGNDFTSNGFVGRIYDIKIYNRALSASEITALALNPNLPMQQEPIWLFMPPPVIDGLSIPIAMHHYKQMQGAA